MTLCKKIISFISERLSSLEINIKNIGNIGNIGDIGSNIKNNNINSNNNKTDFKQDNTIYQDICYFAEQIYIISSDTKKNFIFDATVKKDITKWYKILSLMIPTLMIITLAVFLYFYNYSAEDNIHIIIIVVLFLFSLSFLEAYILRLKNILKNETTCSLMPTRILSNIFKNKAIMGKDKKLMILHIKKVTCPICQGKMDYVADKYDNTIIRCRRNSEHKYKIDPAQNKIEDYKNTKNN